MKILLCTGIYPPDIGGPATYSKLIKKGFNAHGHEVHILTYADNNVSKKKDVSVVNRRMPMFIRYVEYCLRVIDLGRKYDFIYVMDPVSVGLPATLANIILRKKLLLKVVGDYAWEQASQIKDDRLKLKDLDNFYPMNKNYPYKIKLFQKIQVWVAGRANKIITPSFYLKDILTKEWKIDNKKVEVIYNSFVINTVSIPAKAGISFSNFKILSVGRLVPWKGFVELSEIINEMVGVKLDIIGDGSEKEKIKISNKVKLLGRLSHDKVEQYMCSADLFILNTSYEGLSHVVLEAMACGLPVLISTAGGNKELIGENEERGYFFEYNDRVMIKEKIEYIKSNYNEAKAKSKKAREFVSSFNKDKMIIKLENLFKSLN